MRMGRWMSEALHMCCPIVKTRPRCLCVREKERERERSRARARERESERERERELQMARRFACMCASVHAGGALEDCMRGY
jgi:hypothetical protein